jgi:hypothetical protein
MKTISLIAASLAIIMQLFLDNFIERRRNKIFIISALIVVSLSIIWGVDYLQRSESAKLENQFARLDVQYAAILKTNRELQNKIDPFNELASKLYPNYSENKALSLIKRDIENLKSKTAKIEELAKPPHINFHKLEILKEKGKDAFLVQFIPSTNERLGNLHFSVTIDANNSAQILSIEPSMRGGAFLTGKNSSAISSDGKSAKLNYALMGTGLPSFEINLSERAPILIKSNYLKNQTYIGIPEIFKEN